jgi:hypothetical protein
MMTRMPPNASRVDPRLALVMLAILAHAPASTVEPKFATAMLFFGGGAIAALLSSFLAYINRTVAMEAPQRASLRQALLILAIVAVIGAGASFMTGINMVATAAAERSSSHPKGPKEQPGSKEQSGPKDQQTPKDQTTPDAKPSEAEPSQRVQKQPQDLLPGLIEMRWSGVRT